MMISRFVMILC